MTSNCAIRQHGRFKKSHGQALIESLAVLPFGIGVLLGVLLLTRLHDIESRAIAAARYAAFLRADAPAPLPGALLDATATARVWAPRRLMVGADDQWTQQRFMAGPNPLWRSPSDQAPLLASADSVATRTSDGSLAGVPGRALDAALSATRVVGLLGRGEFDLENNRLLTASARVRLAAVSSLPRPLDQLDLEFSDQLALLADSWSASGPQHVVNRVQPLMPTSAVSALLEALAPIQSLVALIEPEFRNLCVGHVDPEIVPADRLGTSDNQQRTAWRSSCRP